MMHKAAVSRRFHGCHWSLAGNLSAQVVNTVALSNAFHWAEISATEIEDRPAYLA